VSGLIHVEFTATGAQATFGWGTGAYGTDAWKGAADDAAWQAEQAEFLQMTARSDREALAQE